MSLPNYLAKIKSSGIYRFVWDKSEIAGVPAEILRLVVGYSEKGPFNTPVYIASDTEFKSIFGDISKKLEKRGIWFHRLAMQALSKGPIIALNLKKFEGETVEASSFDVADSELPIVSVSVEDIYDTSRFWKLDPEAILPATAAVKKLPGSDTKYISLTSTDSKESSCTVFLRGYKPSGYDVTIKEWYATLGEEVPEYFIDGDKDYSSLLVSDFFAEVFVFKGEFTAALCASEPLNQYFDIVDGKPQLKEYIVNGFGDKIDTLTALAADECSNYVNSYNGCLLPYFKNQQNAYISLDLLFNVDNGVHKMMMNLNSDLLYDGDVKVNEIVTTGWLTDYVFGAALKHTTEEYSKDKTTQTTVDDIVVKTTYDYSYKDVEGKEQTAFDADFIKYIGAETYKFIGGIKYSLIGAKTITVDSKSVIVNVYQGVDSSFYMNKEELYLADDGTTYYNDGTSYVVADLSLVELVTLPVTVTPNEEYTFTSYNSSDIESADVYATGKVKVISKVNGVTTVEVEENTVESFIGKQFSINTTTYTADGVYQLYQDGTALDIWISNLVDVTESVETTYYRYEGTEDDYSVYHSIKLDAKITDDIYVDADSTVYTKSGDDYTVVENAVAGTAIDGTTDGALDFVAVGLLVGDRVIYNDDFYSITELDSNRMKLVDFEGNEVFAVASETVVKCNHSASITCYNLVPNYFEGYEYKNAAPKSNTDYDKLQWQKEILSTLIDYQGLRTGLTSRTDIDYRYIVDTFEAFVDSEVHKELSLICKEKDNAVAFLNFPAAKTFKKCTYSSFTDDKGRFQVKYIAEGANKKKNPGVLFSLASEINGASFASYNTPVTFTDGTVNNYIPAAALVSNNFMDKYSGRQPYYVVAGPTYGRIIYSGLLGPDYNYSRADLDILEPMGVNVTVFVPRLGTYINSNQTAKQTPKTALSSLNVRELVIYLQDEIEKLMQDYQWEFNTPYLRDLIKAKADTICENVQNNGGIQDFINVCDKSNNTDDVIDNEMFVLSTSIEPGRACGKMVQELTLYSSGKMRANITQQ